MTRGAEPARSSFILHPLSFILYPSFPFRPPPYSSRPAEWISKPSPTAAGQTTSAAISGCSPAVAQGRRCPQYVEGRGEGVGQSCGRGQGRGRQHSLGRPTAAGIEDMAVTPALVAERLELCPGGAQAPIAQPQLAQPPVEMERVADPDEPMAAGGCRAGLPRRWRHGPGHCCCRPGRENRRCPPAAVFRRSDPRHNPCRCCPG